MSDLLKKLAEQKELLNPTTGTEETVQAVHVPIEIEIDGGTLRCYISLSPKILNSEQEFFGALEELSKAFKLAVYRKQQSSFGGSRFSGNNGGFNKSWRRY